MHGLAWKNVWVWGNFRESSVQFSASCMLQGKSNMNWLTDAYLFFQVPAILQRTHFAMRLERILFVFF